MANLAFSITVKELQELMQIRGAEAVEAIQTKQAGINGLCNSLKSSQNDGIKSKSIEKRKEYFGTNIIPQIPPKSFLMLMWEAIQDFTLVLLSCCAALSLFLSLYVQNFTTVEGGGDHDKYGWIDAVAIYVAVAIVVFITALNDWQKERQFKSLQAKIESDHLASVVRDGNMSDILVQEIVVGDICLVKYGDLLPADGIIVQSNDLKVDESSLTGETDHVKKGVSTDPMLLSGTHVMEGSGRMIVTAVGINSQAGIIFDLMNTCDSDDKEKNKESKNSKSGDKTATQGDDNQDSSDRKVKRSKKKKSVLQAKLNILASQIGKFGMVMAILTMVILVVKFSVIEFGKEKKPWDTSIHMKQYLDYLIIGITVLVVAVPEGLPLAVTISLAYSVKKMMKDNNLVRHLDACETMGNATSICSDKTGTLTTNRMTVVQCYLAGNFVKTQKELPKSKDLPQSVSLYLTHGIAINSGYSSRVIPSKDPNELPTQLGNKTECALLGFCENLGVVYDDIRLKWPQQSFAKVFTFNSERKSMSTIVSGVDPDFSGFTLFTKGASEIIMSKCTSILDDKGVAANFNESDRDRLIREVIEPMASNGLRTIALAYRNIRRDGQGAMNDQNGRLDFDNEDQVVRGLTLIGIVGIEDPVRPEVPRAIRKCQNAGITVRMVTGDNVNTARSIAIKCGILKPDDSFLVMEGKDFRHRVRDGNGKVRQELMDRIWPHLRVLARSSPQDKYLLVSGIIDSHLSLTREVVAVTGDGTNDGPALKKADVGFAMGIAGTDVAKEASDIILTDDNFTSIVKAVMWGRNVYDSISKFLQFQLTVNLVAIVITVMGAILLTDSPLKAVQMLWVNLLMDSLASLALATESPSEELLQRAPYGRTKPLISRSMLKYIVGQFVYQIAVLCFILYGGPQYLEFEDAKVNKSKSSVHYTLIFNAFVSMTLCNEVNARKIHGQRNVFAGLQRNVLFIIVWVVTATLQVILSEVGGKFFSTEPMPFDLWLWTVFFGFGSLLWGQLLICVPDKVVPAFCVPTRTNRKRSKKPSAYGPNEGVGMMPSDSDPKGLSAQGEKTDVTEAIPMLHPRGGPNYDLSSDEDEFDDDNPLGPAVLKSTGQILWIRGLSRLQTQLKAVRAFRNSVEDLAERKSYAVAMQQQRKAKKRDKSGAFTTSMISTGSTDKSNVGTPNGNLNDTIKNFYRSSSVNSDGNFGKGFKDMSAWPNNDDASTEPSNKPQQQSSSRDETSAACATLNELADFMSPIKTSSSGCLESETSPSYSPKEIRRSSKAPAPLPP